MPRRKLPTLSRRNNSRPNIVSKRSRKIISRRTVKSKKTSSSSNASSWFQTLVVWLLIAAIGVGIAWYVVVWGVIPALLRPIFKDNTIAIVPAEAEGSVTVIHFGDQLKKSHVFILNGDTVVDLPGEYGEYRLSAVYPLLQIEQKDQRYVIGSMNRVTGVFLNKIITTPTQLSATPKELGSQLISFFWNQALHQGKVDTMLLSSWYALQYESVVSTEVPIDQVAARLEKETGGTFAARDECSIAILNSTDISGLAGRLSDIVENNGGVVIRLGQYSELLENSVLLYDPSEIKCKAALEQIATLSPVPFEIKEDSSVQNTFRAPIVAIIGSNFE